MGAEETEWAKITGDAFYEKEAGSLVGASVYLMRNFVAAPVST